MTNAPGAGSSPATCLWAGRIARCEPATTCEGHCPLLHSNGSRRCRSRCSSPAAHVRDEPTAELAAKIAYLEELGEQVLRLQRQGWSVNEIVGARCGGPMLIEVIALV